MPNYRRPWITGAAYFITIVTYRRRGLFVHDETVHLWRRALVQVRRDKSGRSGYAGHDIDCDVRSVRHSRTYATDVTISRMDYRRNYVPGGTFFFTVVTFKRRRFLCTPSARHHLRWVFRICRQRWPFCIEALVLLPDHLHTIWTLPPDDSDFSKRWAWIKKEFTKRYLASGGVEAAVSAGKQNARRRGVWQPKFWEHTCTDETKLTQLTDYIHYNPVKHGLVRCPSDWSYSTLHRFVKMDAYPADWCCPKGLSSKPPDFTSIEHHAGE